MDAAVLLREQLKQAHGLCSGTMQAVTAELAHWPPPGNANPLGASYAHMAISEDALINGMAKGGAPLFASTWGDKTGLSAPPPAPGTSWDEWGRNVKIDLTALQEYANAVFAASAEYLGSLSSADLDRELDLSGFQLGKQSLGWFLGTIVVSHINNHCGEIACLKGLQGAKGYPF